MANEITKKSYETGLDKITNTFLPSVVDSLRGVGLETNDYQKQCMVGALQKMNDLRKKWDGSVTEWRALDATSIKNTLIQIAESELSVTSFPTEASIVLRGDQFTFSPQGEGWRKLVEKYGIGVKRVHEPWLVREKDDFKYPHFKGISIEPPEWTPKGSGKVVRVVYPVEMVTGEVQYLIAEREEVKTNLLMAIGNNLIKKEDRETKNSIFAKAKDMTLEQILADKDICIKGKLSAAWNGPSQENMIVRKMKNNALKNFPKDYHNTFVATAMEDIASNEEVEQAPTQVIDMTADTDSRREIDTEAMSTKKPAVSDFEEKPVPFPTKAKEETKKPYEKPVMQEVTPEDMPF